MDIVPRNDLEVTGWGEIEDGAQSKAWDHQAKTEAAPTTYCDAPVGLLNLQIMGINMDSLMKDLQNQFSTSVAVKNSPTAAQNQRVPVQKVGEIRNLPLFSASFWTHIKP